MKTINDLKVGDTVWIMYANDRTHTPRPETVTKIGSKLFTVDDRVYRKNDLQSNDNYRHHSVILDLEDEKIRQQRNKNLWRIQHAVTGSRATADQVIEAAKLLGITLEGGL